jgi:hypothetical protein
MNFSHWVFVLLTENFGEISILSHMWNLTKNFQTSLIL